MVQTNRKTAMVEKEISHGANNKVAKVHFFCHVMKYEFAMVQTNKNAMVVEINLPWLEK